MGSWSDITTDSVHSRAEQVGPYNPIKPQNCGINSFTNILCHSQFLDALANPDRRTPFTVYYSLSHYHPFGKCHSKWCLSQKTGEGFSKSMPEPHQEAKWVLLVTSLHYRLGLQSDVVPRTKFFNILDGCLPAWVALLLWTQAWTIIDYSPFTIRYGHTTLVV